MNDSERLLSAFSEVFFFKEFVIDDLCYTPCNKSQIELADLLINLDRQIIVIQLKTRNKKEQTHEIIKEEQWLRNKCKKAKAQAKNTLHLLIYDDLPAFKNKRGQPIKLRKDAEIIPLVVFENESIGSYQHLLRKHSDESIDINCLSFQDFKEMCHILATPRDIVLYLNYRRSFYDQQGEVGFSIVEIPPNILISKPQNKESLARTFLLEKYGSERVFQQNRMLTLFSSFMHDLPSHLVNGSANAESYRLLLFLANLNREELFLFFDRLIRTRDNAKRGRDKMHSLRREDNEYAIVFVPSRVLDHDLLMQEIQNKANVKKIMEVSVYWENKTDYRIDFAFWGET